MPTPHFSVRGYVAAQGYERNISALNAFIEEHGRELSAVYVEEDAGGAMTRPQLFTLLAEAQAGDVLLCERIRRLGRLKETDWKTVRQVIQEKQLRVVALDVPGSWAAMGRDGYPAVMNELLLDILGAVSLRQHQERLRNAQAGIDKAKEAGLYKGRVPDAALHERIRLLLAEGVPIRKIATVCDCSKSTVQAVKAAQTTS
jgi:DNA invertase Pin-like site-specific DNA recombinase